MYATIPKRYTKRLGVPRDCEWCGEPIEVGESYDKWVCYDASQRVTVYAHSECADEWGSQVACGELDQDDTPDGSCERPEVSCGGPQEACMRPNCPECGYKPSRAPETAEGAAGEQLPQVLDVCCGGRMFWYDKEDPRAIFLDKRRDTYVLKDKSSKGGVRELVIVPDIVADFTALPFNDCQFALVVFDPPNLTRNGGTGWLAKKYGQLGDDWPDMLRKGFAECFRVLRPHGTLIFKWCEYDIPLSRILKLTPEKPLFGHRSGKQQKTHWIAFIKQTVLTKRKGD